MKLLHATAFCVTDMADPLFGRFHLDISNTARETIIC